MSDIEKSKTSLNGSLKDLDMSLHSVEPVEMSKGKWDTVAIIADASSSMQESIPGGMSKIEAEKDALINMLKKGMAGSKIYLVECPGEDGYPHSFVPTTNPKQIITIVRTMYSSGMTPMFGALEIAYDKTKGQKVRFILMSDGMPNDCHNEDILDLVKKKEVVIDTIGIGDPSSGNYDPDFLKKIAEITGGIYKEIHNYQQFMKELYALSPAERIAITDGSTPKKGGAIAL
jgi:Mg-chelatase subunit ChlD